MRTYDYRCRTCGETFERVAGLLDRFVEGPCGHQAERRPFSGVPNLKGETVSRSIPDPSYRIEAEKRDLNSTWGDASRSAEMLRKNAYNDGTGMKKIDMAGMKKDGG
jgi:putative FmdB family regulatory protein